jgi:hypothetical protein
VEASEVVVLVMQKAADQPVEYLKITMDVADVLRLCGRVEDGVDDWKFSSSPRTDRE